MMDYDKIKDFECPFNWKLNEIQHRRIAEHMIEKVKEKNDELIQPWSSMCLSLTTAYLHYELNNNAKCLELLKGCQQLLQTTKDPVLIKYQLAFSSVLNGSRAVFAFKNSATSEAKEFLEKATPYSMLNKEQQSAVLELKSNVFMEFGLEGTKAALAMSKEAVALNPVESDWHFQLGKLLSRIRHYDSVHEPSSEEIIHFEKAYSLSATARAAVFLGNAYLERARAFYYDVINGKAGEEMKLQIEQDRIQAKTLLLTALELDKDGDVHIGIRCAFGLSSLPYYDRNLEKAKELVKLALEKSPHNTMGQKLAGDICMKEIPPKREEALEHYQMAASKGVFSVHFIIFDIKISLGMNPDPEEFFQHLQAKFSEVEFKTRILLHAANYYLFIKEDLLKAIHYFLTLIELDPAFVKIKENFVIWIKKTVNLFELLANEVRCALYFQLYKDEDEVKQLKKAMEVIKEYAPEVTRNPLERNKIATLFSKKQERYDGGSRTTERFRGGDGRVTPINRSNEATLGCEFGRDRGRLNEIASPDQSNRNPNRNWRSSSQNRPEGEYLRSSSPSRPERENWRSSSQNRPERETWRSSSQNRPERETWRSSAPNSPEREYLRSSSPNRPERETWRSSSQNRPEGETWRSSAPNRPEREHLRSSSPNRPERETWRSSAQNRPERETWRSSAPNRPEREHFRSSSPNRPERETWRSSAQSRPERETWRSSAQNRPERETWRSSPENRPERE